MGSRATNGLARDSLLTGVGSVVTAVAGFAFTLLASRTLGPAGAGGVFVLIAWFMMVTTGLRLGTDTTLVRAASQLRVTQQLAALNRTMATLLLPVCVLSFVVAGIIALLSSNLGTGLIDAQAVGLTAGQAAATVVMLAIIAPLQSLTVPIVALLRGLGDIRPLVIVEQLVKPLSRVILISVFAFMTPSVVDVTAAWAFPVAAGFIVAVAMLLRGLRHLKRSTEPTDTESEPRQNVGAMSLWRYSAPRAAAQLIEIGTLSIGVVLVGHLAGAVEAGLYAAVSRLALAGMLAWQAIRLVSAPELAGLLAEERLEDVQAVHHVTTGWVTVISWPFYLLLAGLSPIALSLFGPEFRSGVPALVVVCMGMLIPTLIGPAQSLALMAGWSGAGLIVSICCLSANVGLTVVLARQHGAAGAAAGWAVALALEALLYLLLVWRRLGVVAVGTPALRCAGTALVIIGIPMLALTITGSADLARVVCAAIASLVYVVVVLTFKDRLAVDGLVSPLTHRRWFGRSGTSTDIRKRKRVRRRERR